MLTLIMSLMFMGSNGILSTPPPSNQQVATVPKETATPTRKAPKKSRGKGRGSVPHFAKYLA